tara:strand:+ start:9398 stop:9697 length:300 start_codon:yes stop_codon:yes gene_type:complete
MKIKFNDVANAISVASGVTLAAVIAAGSYVYVNRETIIEEVKEAAIEAAMESIGIPSGLGGAVPELPQGASDLPATGGSVGSAAGSVGGSMLPIPNSPL